MPHKDSDKKATQETFLRVYWKAKFKEAKIPAKFSTSTSSVII